MRWQLVLVYDYVDVDKTPIRSTVGEVLQYGRESLDAGPFYLASLLAVPPRDEAVVERGGGGQHVVGVGRHEGGREGAAVASRSARRRTWSLADGDLLKGRGC